MSKGEKGLPRFVKRGEKIGQEELETAEAYNRGGVGYLAKEY